MDGKLGYETTWPIYIELRGNAEHLKRTSIAYVPCPRVRTFLGLLHDPDNLIPFRDEEFGGIQGVAQLP